MMPFSYYFMLYMLCIRVECDDDERIHQLRVLVEKEGWSMQNHILQVRENENYHDVHNLFTSNSVAITPNNIDEKLRHVRLFLSCDYAVLLTEYCDYIKTLGQECKKKENPNELLHCLERYHQKLKDSNPWIMRMLGAFSYFVKLSQTTKFNKQVPEILYYLKNYYDTKEINISEFYGDNGNIKIFKVLVRIQDIEDTLTSVVSFSHMFLKSNCLLNSNYDKVIDSILTPSPVESITTIIETIDKCINLFIKLHYEHFGFHFDAIANTTYVGDPSSIAKMDEGLHEEMVNKNIDKFNEILSCAQWTKPYTSLDDDCGIVESGYEYSFKDLFYTYRGKKLVSHRNYDTIIRQAYQSLSCKYARFLKDYVDYAYGVSFYFGKPVDKGELSDLKDIFIDLIRYGKNMLKPMKFSLLSFDQLSQDIEFNTNISVAIDYILCYFDQVKFNSPSFRFTNPSVTIEMVSEELQYSKNILSFVERYLRLFLREFCWPTEREERTKGISIPIRTMDNRTRPSEYPDLLTRLRNIIGNLYKVTSDFNKVYGKFGLQHNASSSNVFYSK